jgi:hypothetical protein
MVFYYICPITGKYEYEWAYLSKPQKYDVSWWIVPGMLED